MRRIICVKIWQDKRNILEDTLTKLYYFANVHINTMHDLSKYPHCFIHSYNTILSYAFNINLFKLSYKSEIVTIETRQHISLLKELIPAHI